MRLPLHRGQHRAPDRITALEAERDTLLAQLVQADQVIGRYATQRTADAERIETLIATVEALTVENSSLRNDWDQLWARYRAASFDLAAAKAVANRPAPKAIAPAATPAVFAIDGTRQQVRTLTVRTLTALNEAAA